MANIHIEGSSKMNRSEFLCNLWSGEPTQDWTTVVNNRSERSLLREWAAHKLLYSLCIAKSHTESVDLNYPQKLIVRILYWLVGGCALIFYR